MQILFLFLIKITLSLLTDGIEKQLPSLTFQVSDAFFRKENMTHWLGKEHLSLNKKLNQIQQTKPMIWGQSDYIILILEVNYDKKTCRKTHNVIFLLDTGLPYTLISPTVKELIMWDCQIPATTPQKIPIKINGREVKAAVAKGYYNNVNVLGMDFMKANSIEFNMKINKQYRDLSQLSFKFDAWN